MVSPSSKRIEPVAPGLEKSIAPSGGMDPHGKKLGRIVRNHLSSVNVKIPGIAVLTPKK